MITVHTLIVYASLGVLKTVTRAHSWVDIHMDDFQRLQLKLLNGNEMYVRVAGRRTAEETGPKVTPKSFLFGGFPVVLARLHSLQCSDCGVSKSYEERLDLKMIDFAYF